MKRPRPIRGVEIRERKRRGGEVYFTFRVRYRDSSGERRSRDFDTSQDALDFRAQLRTLDRLGDLASLDVGRELLADFVQDWWALHAARNLSVSTLPVYKSLWNTHANPRLGHLELRQVTPLILEQFAADLADDGVGAPTIRKTMSMLQGILGRAVAWGKLRTNPALAAKKPAAPTQRVAQPLAPATIERLRQELVGQSKAHGARDATLVSVLAYAGLRPEEALALQWRHVRKGTLLVEQKLVHGRIVPGSKTGQSSRTVKLVKPLAQDLAAFALLQGRRDVALIFPRPDGKPWLVHDVRNWRRRIFRKAGESIGLDKPRPYDLRHSFASLLIHEGRPLMEIAAQLGHSVQTLLRHYAHLIAEMDGQRPIPAERAILNARAKLDNPRLKVAK